jgi:predicted GIY-YIG superfamily endonuclease
MTVYLIHLYEPIGRPWTDEERAALDLPPRKEGSRYTASHYIGFAENLENRIRAHQSGRGSQFMRNVSAAGIRWTVARTWPGEGRDYERHLKAQKHAARLCPICNPRAFENQQGTKRLDEVYRNLEYCPEVENETVF